MKLDAVFFKGIFIIKETILTNNSGMSICPLVIFFERYFFHISSPRKTWTKWKILADLDIGKVSKSGGCCGQPEKSGFFGVGKQFPTPFTQAG